MTVGELVKYLQEFDQSLEAVQESDEFSTYHPVPAPRLIGLAKGNMLRSDGEHWVEDKGPDMWALVGQPIVVTKTKTAVWI